MQHQQNLHDSRLGDAWATLKAQSDAGLELSADATRIAFADPEFLLRRDTRGIRLQLELLKPDIEQAEHGIENTIVVFGSARFKSEEAAKKMLLEAQQGSDAMQIAKAQRMLKNSAHYEQARLFGRLVASYSADKKPEDKLFICTGGGPGIMEAANRGAHEVGGISVGLSIALPFEEQPNPYVTPHLSFKFHYFAVRKMHFMMRAKALVACPGGFGTLDELFEIMTLVQTRKSKPVPIFLLGKDYWTRLINFDVLIEEGTISPQDTGLFTITDDPHEVWQAIKAFYKLP
jgi:uncharacterized protein (TIGR00730 family)